MTRAVDLIIFDDIVPSQFSPFRTVEYSHLLWFFNSALVSTQGWHTWIENAPFDEQRASFPVDVETRSRIVSFDQLETLAGKLGYVTFLTNAHRLLPTFTRANLPFMLQLYPGGGFQIDRPESDAMLRAVVDSPLCRGIITTQTITADYLRKLGVADERIHPVYGGVFDSHNDFLFDAKLTYPERKQTLDLCFVAHKYGDDLTSKGYDFFVAMAKALAPRFDHLRFHVVGGYGPEDVPLGPHADRFEFHGKQPSAFFAEFYPRMDAIVSFNRSFVLMPGAFDGFPTGACIEAGFRGVLNILRDPLDLNVAFEDGRDIVLLGPDQQAAIDRIGDLLANPAQLYAIARANWHAFHREFDTDRQLWARARLLGRELMRQTQLIFMPPPAVNTLDTSRSGDLHADSLERSAARLRIAELERAYVRLEEHAKRLESGPGNRIVTAIGKMLGRNRNGSRS
jgi:glycosyltransferase involved in cell wall biosynthesis